MNRFQSVKFLTLEREMLIFCKSKIIKLLKISRYVVDHLETERQYYLVVLSLESYLCNSAIY